MSTCAVTFMLLLGVLLPILVYILQDFRNRLANKDVIIKSLQDGLDWFHDVLDKDEDIE